MSTLEAAWVALAARAEVQVAATVAAYEAGAVSSTAFAQSAALAVYAANVQAMAFADTAVAAFRLATLGLPTATLGLLPPREDAERLVRAFATIAAHATAVSTLDRSTRVARAEPMDRGRNALQEGYRRRGITEWRRVVQPDACEVCAPLAGEVHPIDVVFTDHVHCRCSLAPVVPQGWGDRQRAEQFQLRRTFQTPTQTLRFSSGIRIG